MNQILFTGLNLKKVDVKSIIKFFCIFIMLFGIVLVGQGIYSVNKISKYKKIIAALPSEPKSSPPVASITKISETEVRIIATDDNGVKSITYNWNGEVSFEISGAGKTNIEETIALREGNNTLNVTVEDIDGNKKTFTHEFSTEQGEVPEDPSNGIDPTTGEDIEKPVIELVNTGSTLKITAKDNVGLKYILYKWGEEEERKIEPGDNNAIIETMVPIPTGDNTITVTALDTNNNTQMITKQYKTIVKPTIEITQRGDAIIIIAKDAKQIDNVKYILGEKKYKIVPDFETDIVEYEVKLNEGENELTVIATNSDGETKTYESVYTYYP